MTLSWWLCHKIVSVTFTFFFTFSCRGLSSWHNLMHDGKRKHGCSLIGPWFGGSLLRGTSKKSNLSMLIYIWQGNHISGVAGPVRTEPKLNFEYSTEQLLKIYILKSIQLHDSIEGLSQKKLSITLHYITYNKNTREDYSNSQNFFWNRQILNRLLFHCQHTTEGNYTRLGKKKEKIVHMSHVGI